MDISACGAVKSEWLASWNVPESEQETAWDNKCRMDEKVAMQNGRIVPNSGIIPDIQPYKSQIDGSMIESRTKHRSHLKQHGCIEVGNEKMPEKKVERSTKEKQALRQEIAARLDSQPR